MTVAQPALGRSVLPFNDSLRPQLSYYRGRVALQSILRALGVGRGDKVLLQAFTCIAVAEAVFASGATPVFVDIESHGYNMDPDALDARIDASTRAIVVQHTFGIPAQMSRIMQIAARRGLPVIEDCCHTFHSQVDGRTVGTFGVAAFYSFEWGKPMILGLGGAAVAHDAGLRERLLRANASELEDPPLLRQVRLEAQYRAFSLLYRPAFYWWVRGAFRALSSLGVAEGSFHAPSDVPSPEFAWRMAPLLARRFPRKVARLTGDAQAARNLVEQYRSRLVSPAIVHPSLQPTDVLVRYPLRVERKDELLRQARKARVELAGWYTTPVHPVPVTQLTSVGLDPAECPHAVRRCMEIVSLPVNRRVSDAAVERAVRLLRAHGVG